MGKGSSESSTTSQSSTTNADQRVAAEGSSVAIGAGAQYNPTYTFEFPQEVADFANKLLDFAGGVLSKANDVVVKAVGSGEAAVTAANTTAAAAVNQSQLGNASILNNILPIVIVGAVVVVAINLFKKKG